jgi:hypothetical protein
MVIGLPPISWRDGVFSGCVLDKHHRDSFDKSSSWNASGPLQLVHSDLCGPLSSPSFSRCKYFLTFIDDFSRCTWVYFLKLKSEVFDKFLAYKALVEKKAPGGCVLDKHHRDSFEKILGTPHALCSLFSDLCGPLSSLLFLGASIS